MRFGPIAGLVGCAFGLILECTCFWPRTDQVYLFLASAPPKNVSNQIDNWNHLYLSNFPVGYSVILLYSYLRTFHLIHNLARQIWAPWCTPVWQIDSSFRDLLPSRPRRRKLNMWFQALDLPFLLLSAAMYIFTALSYTYKDQELVLVFQKSALVFPLAPTVETRATQLRFLSRRPR